MTETEADKRRTRDRSYTFQGAKIDRQKRLDDRNAQKRDKLQYLYRPEWKVWLTGKDKNIDLAVRTIQKIENESHISGLTDRIVKFLKEEKGIKVKEPQKEIEEKEEIKTEEQEQEEENLWKNLRKSKRKKSGGILDELLDK